VAVALLVFGLAAPSPAPAPGPRAILLLRHAERADPRDPDGSLAEAGAVRARRLVDVLKDAGVTAIYTTRYKRTRETAAPLAAALGIAATTVGVPAPGGGMAGASAEDDARETAARSATARPTRC
jgi:broad specificity phosphatase PhoE